LLLRYSLGRNKREYLIISINGCNGLKKDKLPEIFQSFVKDSHQENADTRTDHSTDSLNVPSLEQDNGLVICVKVHLRERYKRG
jgi:hypothetical protein